MMALFARPFRPENESEADRDAVEWMMAAGYEPKELSRMLNQWDAKQSQTAPWMDFVPGFVKNASRSRAASAESVGSESGFSSAIS